MFRMATDKGSNLNNKVFHSKPYSNSRKVFVVCLMTLFLTNVETENNSTAIRMHA